MSISADYSKKFNHNEEFIAYVQKSSEFPDWEIIVTFYAALHFMNLFLSNNCKVDIEKISSHTKRNELIEEKCSDKITSAYIALYNLSREARYQFTDVSKKIVYVREKYAQLKKLCQEAMAVSVS